jgi:DNA recombination protein RmuC
MENIQVETLVALLAVLFAVVAGWVAGWSVRNRTLAQLLRKLEIDSAEAMAKAERLSNELQAEKVARATAETTAKQVPELAAELKGERAKVERLTAEKSSLETGQTMQQQAFDEKAAVLTALRAEIEEKIKNLASEALRGNQKSFLELANEVFEMHKNTSTADLDQRKKAIEDLLAPFCTTLEEYKKELFKLETARVESYASLSTELKNVVQTQSAVRAETSKLVNALRAAPKTRGRWGEHQLHNLLELAGMTLYVDFFPEQTYVREEERLRPDVLIRLRGNRHIVIDAKTSMDAYLKAVEAVDEEAREAHLKEHALQMRQHMKRLAAKSYWDSLTVTPDFVVMFVPGENFFAAAIERDPDLFEDAIKQRVLITTPTTLIALAKAIAFGWRQEKVAENARRIADLGRDLYKRLQTMGGRVLDVGKHLEKTVKTYNDFVATLEGSVMPQARKFNELEVEGTQQILPEITPLETDVRQLRSDRDLILSSSDGIGSLSHDGAPVPRADGS